MLRAITVLFILASTSSYAQSFHLGLFGGLSNYQGDLTARAYAPNTTRAAFGLTGSYDLSSRVSLRSGLTLAKIAGNDKDNVASAKARNLNFESKITELSLVAEFNVFNLDNIRWTPYAFGGLALYHFNPYTSDSTGIKTFLKPLSTEGQGISGYSTKPYALTQLSLPFGGGIKYAFSDNVRLGLELGMRKLFTDHLDDVSTSYAAASDLLAERGPKAVALAYRGDELPTGNPAYPAKGEQRGGAKEKDWYYFTGLHLNFRLNAGGGRGGKYGCPTTF
jgi:opacity protein-like surface antigen